jgi:proteasome-associated ATPase
MTMSKADKETIDTMEEMKMIILQQKMVIERLKSPPTPYIPVLGIIKTKEEVMNFKTGEKENKVVTKAISSFKGSYIEVSIPEEAEKGIEMGALMRVTDESLQFIEWIPKFDQPAGHVYIISKVISKSMAEVIEGDGARAVSNFLPKAPELGDRVLLDPTANLITRNFGKEEKQFVFTEETHVCWDDIGGHERAKEELIEAVILPNQHPEIYKAYHKKRSKGVLLFGEPGNGKTLLAKALATEVAKVFGKKSSTGFMYVKGPELLSKWVGESERQIREIFQRTKEHFKKHGYPAVLFVDEADALIRKRGSQRSSDVETTIVPQFLSEMDGMEESGAFVVLASNRPDTIDPAALRDGRIDRKIFIGAPDEKMSSDIFKIHLKDKPLAGGISIEDFAKASANQLFSKENGIYEIERKSGDKHMVSLGTITTGAMVAGLVERATTLALMRDLKGNKVCGISPENMAEAIRRVLGEQRSMDHKDKIDQITESWKSDVKKVSKVS